MEQAMVVTLNGEPRAIADHLTLGELVATLDLKPERVAIERNGAIQPRPTWADTLLADGDVLEIVHFVGGG